MTSSQTLPDAHLEKFWIIFKDSIKNLYRSNGMDLRQIKCLDSVSDRLNLLQKEKRYAEIEIQINIYMIDFSRTVIKFGDLYYASLFKTNLKRWQNITTHSINNIYISLFECLFRLLNTDTQTKKVKEFIQYIRNIIHIDDKNKDNIDCIVWIDMIDLAIKTGKPSVLDIINDYYDIVEYVNDVYDLSLPLGTKGLKITRVLIKFIERD
jgi:hypothetical protein